MEAQLLKFRSYIKDALKTANLAIGLSSEKHIFLIHRE